MLQRLNQRRSHGPIFFLLQIIVIGTISTNIFTLLIYLLYYVTFLQVSTKLIQAV